VVSRPVVIGVIAIAVLAVAYFMWPSLIHTLQQMHGPFGGGPGMHGLR
jgi:hypothetical protein